jgi:hypothetical protein
MLPKQPAASDRPSDIPPEAFAIDGNSIQIDARYQAPSVRYGPGRAPMIGNPQHTVVVELDPRRDGVELRCSYFIGIVAEVSLTLWIQRAEGRVYALAKHRNHRELKWHPIEILRATILMNEWPSDDDHGFNLFFVVHVVSNDRLGVYSDHIAIPANALKK